MFPLPLQFHAYGFFIGLGVVVSVWLIEWILKREKIQLHFNKLVIFTVVGGVVGARLYHLVTDWQLYVHASFFDLIAVWNGGIGFVGALLGGLMGLLLGLYAQKKKTVFLSMLDAIALSLPFAQGIGRWGNYFNQELYGVATRLPWGLVIKPENLLPGLDPHLKYHPLFLYESIHLLLFGMIMIWVYKSGKTSSVGSGIFIGMYCLFYAGLRFSLEFLRVDSARFSWDLFSFLTIAQWMMFGLFFIGVTFVIRSYKYATQ